MAAGAADEGGLNRIAVSLPSAVTSEVLAAEASRTSTAAAADGRRDPGTTAADAGAGPATSQAHKDDHAWQAGPRHCEDWELTMDYRRPPRPVDPRGPRVRPGLHERRVATVLVRRVAGPGRGGRRWRNPDLGARVRIDEHAGGPAADGGQAVAEARRRLPSVSGCPEATSDRPARPTSPRTEPVAESSTTPRSPSARTGRGPLWLGTPGGPPRRTRRGHPWSPPEEPEPLPAKCQDEQLTLEFVARPDLSVAGASGFELVFTNASDTACSMWGWPGLIVESADGTRIGSSRTVGDMGEPFVLGERRHRHRARLGARPRSVGLRGDRQPDHLRAYVTSDGAGPGVVGTAQIPVCADGSSVLEIGPLTAA